MLYSVKAVTCNARIVCSMDVDNQINSNMTTKRTFQLSVRDVPTAFDYSVEQNILVVTSSSDISFYKLEDLGSPSHIIYYEQPVKCKSVKVQHGGQGLVSCISDSLVSIWDPSRSVKPMIDFVHPSKGLQDIQWSPHYSETVATSSSAGNLTMWDIRTSMRPTHDLMVSKACGKIAWCPSNPNLISSTCEDRYLLVWDIRMMPPTNNCNARVGDVEDQQVHVIESEEGIANYAWSPIGTAVYLTTGNCGLDVWSLAHSEDDLFDSSRISTSHSSLVNNQTKVLPGPYGQRLALLHCRPRTGESSVYMRKFQDVVLAGSVASTESTYAPSIDSPGHEGEKSQQTDPFVKVGSSKSRILDMKWLNNASVSSRGGYTSSNVDNEELDLLLLNEDALLQVLHVPSETSRTGGNPARIPTPMSYFTKRAHLGSPRLGNSTNDLPFQEQKALRQMKQSIGAADRMDSMFSDKTGGTSSRDGNSSGNLMRDRSEFERNLSGPAKRYSLGQKSQSSAALSANPQLQMVGPVTFQNLLEDDLIALEYGINHGYLEGWRIGRIDPFTRRIFLELLIPNIDSYSIANKHSNASFNTFYRSEDLNSFYHQKRTANVRFVELAVTFPVKYACFWSPTLAIENKSGLAFNPTSLSGLIIELTAICRTFAEKNSSTAAGMRSGDASIASSRRTGSDSFAPHMNDCLLFQLARSFRKRLFRLWEKIIESDRITISSTTAMQQQAGGSGGESNILSTSLQSDHAMEVDEDAPYMKYIEPLAFRVPAPVCSAGIFNGRGELICFGNAKVCLTESACHSSLDSAVPATPPPHTAVSHPHSTGKHKSFANLLVSKIIMTSAEADNSTSAEDANTANKPTNSSKNKSVSSNIVTFESPGRSKNAKKQFEPIVHATLPGNKPLHPRTSSESEVSEENNTPLHEDEDEEYQFTFDHETKAPAPAKDTVRRTSITGVQRAPSGEEKKPAPLIVSGQCSPAEELTRAHSDRSLGFAKDSAAVGATAVNQKPASSSRILLQLYKVMYGVERRLLYSYSVGPLSRRLESTTSTPITPVAQAVANQVAANTLAAKDSKTAKAKARSTASQVPPALTPPSRTSSAVPALTQEEALDRAAACRRNARAVFEISPEDKGLCQFWNLLAVVLDMLTITDSGCLIGWNHCTIGLALLHRLYKYLCENADLQTFATAICILGGSDILVDLLVPYYNSQSSSTESSDQHASAEEKQSSKLGSPEAPRKRQFEPIQTKKHLEMILYSYNDVLNRWGEQLSAVEVSKHINFDYFGPNPRALLHDAKGCEISVKVCCYYCEKEIEPKRLSGEAASPSSGGIGTVSSTSSSRPNSRTGAQVTFHPGTGGGAGAASGSSTTSGLAPGSNTLLWCGDCKDWAQRCVVCELAVRGSVSVCAKCGHGGHFAHMQTWFKKSAVCASGCGCRCIAEGEENSNEDDSSDSDKDAEEFVEDGENVRDIYDIFGTNPPNYLEEIYNRTSDYNYNNFFEKWADSPAGEVYFEYS